MVNLSLVNIFQVTQATVSLLDNVDADVFDHPVSPTLLDEYLSNPANVIIVAIVDGQVIGMATGIAYVHPDKPRTLFVNEVGVSRRHHRQGIGKQLVSAILAWGKSQGCLEAWVATEVGNAAARSLYRSTGGVEDEERAIVYSYSLADGPKESSNASTFQIGARKP